MSIFKVTAVSCPSKVSTEFENQKYEGKISSVATDLQKFTNNFPTKNVSVYVFRSVCAGYAELVYVYYGASGKIEIVLPNGYSERCY